MQELAQHISLFNSFYEKWVRGMLNSSDGCDVLQVVCTGVCYEDRVVRGEELKLVHAVCDQI